jgi:hypothetical protein
VQADEDEGAGGVVHYVTVEQDLDQSLEVCVSACVTKASPGLFINLCVSLHFWIYLLLLFVHLRPGVEMKP